MADTKEQITTDKNAISSALKSLISAEAQVGSWDKLFALDPKHPKWGTQIRANVTRHLEVIRKDTRSAFPIVVSWSMKGGLEKVEQVGFRLLDVPEKEYRWAKLTTVGFLKMSDLFKTPIVYSKLLGIKTVRRLTEAQRDQLVSAINAEMAEDAAVGYDSDDPDSILEQLEQVNSWEDTTSPGDAFLRWVGPRTPRLENKGGGADADPFPGDEDSEDSPFGGNGAHNTVVDKDESPFGAGDDGTGDDKPVEETSPFGDSAGTGDGAPTATDTEVAKYVGQLKTLAGSKKSGAKNAKTLLGQQDKNTLEDFLKKAKIVLK